jgi:hypothetical protein
VDGIGFTPRAARAFSLAETAMCVLLVGGVLVVALNTVGDATVGRQKMGDEGRGHLLAQDLMAEILQKAYEEPDETITFGPEVSEGSGSRVDFDDVDDYHGRDESPPQEKDGATKAGLDGWRRTVTVELVYPDKLNTKTASTDEGIKRIAVDVTFNGVPMASLVAVRTAAAETFTPNQ